MSQTKPTVLLGMSGGVDSSVSVHLLQQAGYDVYGVHMLLIPEAWQPDLSSAEDAKAVAKQFGIPLTVLNLREEFEKRIVQLFAREYNNGRTPNPCVYCNRQIKFGLLAEYAKEQHADFISTGHYIRVKESAYGKKLFHKAQDPKKDQSYFLSLVSPSVVDRCIFPLGEYTKPQVRDIARKIGLPVAEKKDSQEICFIPDNDYKHFLQTILPSNAFQKGTIYYTDGTVLGTHSGIQNYTIGQRKGLGVALGKPAYVIGLDARRNRVLLGDAEDLLHNQLTASQNNFFVSFPYETPIAVEAKIRYRAAAAPAQLWIHRDGMATIRFESMQRAITPGQCVSYYQGDVLLGGGIIEEARTVSVLG